MPTNAWRGDAEAKPRIMRFIAPVNVIGVEPVISVNGREMSWADWDAAVIAAGLNASGWPELANITATAENDDLVLTGAENDDWDVELAIKPSVSVELVQGVTAKNQISRVSFDGATSGTYVLSVNEEETAAITVGDIADARTKLAALTGTFTVTEVTGGDYLIEFSGALAAEAVAVAIDGANTVKALGAIVIEQMNGALAQRHEVIVVGMPASESERFDYLGEFGYIRSNMTAAELQALMLEMHPGTEVRVHGGQYNPGADDEAAQFVIEFTGRPGGSDIYNQSSPNNFFTYGTLEMVQIVSGDSELQSGAFSGVSTSNELMLFDTTNGSITLTYRGTELTIPQGSTAAAVETLLADHGEFDEFDTFDAPNWAGSGTGVPTGGGDNHPKLVFVSFDGSIALGPNVSETTGWDVPETYLRQTGGDGVMTVLKHGGSGAVGANYAIYRTGNVTGGTFDIQLAEGTISGLAWNVTAAAFETAAQLVRATAQVDQGAGSAGSPWVFELGTGSDLDQIPAAVSNLTGPASPAVAIEQARVEGVNAVHTVIVSPRAASGNVLLKYGTEGPVAFAYNLNAAAFKTELEKFPSLATTGDTAVAYDSGSGRYTITYQGNLAATRVRPLTVSSSTLATATDESNAEVDQRATGPSDWSNPKNWTLDRLPEYGDHAVVDTMPDAIEYGFRQYCYFTADSGTDILTTSGKHDFRDNQKVRVFIEAGATIPTGLAIATDYFVVNSDTTNGTLQLAASAGGDPIDITANGSGTMTVGVYVDRLTLTSNATENIGREENTPTFREYRPRYLRMAAGNRVDVGDGNGAGTQLTRVDFVNSPPIVRVLSTGSSNEDGYPAFNVLAQSSGCRVAVMEGSVGIAAGETEAAQIEDVGLHGGDLQIGTLTITTDFYRTAGTWQARSLTVNGEIKVNG